MVLARGTKHSRAEQLEGGISMGVGSAMTTFPYVVWNNVPSCYVSGFVAPRVGTEMCNQG